jgi:hypothetical protein
MIEYGNILSLDQKWTKNVMFCRERQGGPILPERG